MPTLETSLEYCTYCPTLCRHACPVSTVEARETYTPQTKMATMRLLRLHLVDSDVEATASLYACSACGACSEQCRHHIQPGVHLFQGRHEAERRGHGHPALASLPERVRAHGEASAARLRELFPGPRDPSAPVAILPSCEEPEAARAVIALAARFGERVEVADVRSGCGGYPLLAGGFFEAFRVHAEALAHDLGGHAKLLVACPACAWTLKVQFPEHGVPLAAKVLHPVEFLAPLLAAATLPPRTGDQAAVAYHDPCYLGRHLGVYEAPRDLLRQVRPLVELPRRRQESVCSGGGGLLPLTMPAAAEAMARERAAEIRETGATVVATACASCRKRLTRDGVTAVDLVELVERELAGAAPRTAS